MPEPARPTRLRIGGYRYEIEPQHAALNSQLLGKIDSLQGKIYLETNVYEDQQKETLMHEILHGIDIFTGAIQKVTEEENLARGQALFDFLRRPENRQAILWIMHED